jgi:hypothetical protein
MRLAEIFGTGLTNNGSGESSASIEAQNRLRGEKSKGISRVKINSLTGDYVPLVTVDGVDTRPRDNEIIVLDHPNGKMEIVSQGNSVKNTEAAINRYKQKKSMNR